METVAESGRGLPGLEQLALQWDALAAAATQLAADHRAVHQRLTQRKAKASYAVDYDRLLRQAAWVEALASEAVARDVAVFKRVTTWKLLADSLRLSLSGAHLRYKIKGVKAYAKLTNQARGHFAMTQSERSMQRVTKAAVGLISGRLSDPQAGMHGGEGNLR